MSPTSVAEIHHGRRRLRYEDRNRWMERRREAGSAVPDNQGVSIKPFAPLLSQYQFGPRCPTDNHPLHGNSGPRCSRVTKQQQDASNAQTTRSLAFTLPGACPQSQGTQARATVGLNKCPAGVKSPDTDSPTIAPSKQNQFGRPDSLAIKLKQGRKEGLNYSTNCDGRGCTFRHLAKHFSLKSLLSPTQFQGNVPQTLQPTEMHQTLLVTEHRYTSEKKSCNRV